jgi:hypothetical protein
MNSKGFFLEELGGEFHHRGTENAEGGGDFGEASTYLAHQQ